MRPFFWDVQKMFVPLLYNDLSSNFFFFTIFPSFFRSRSCSLALNAAQLDPSWGGRNRWQSCLISNIERESGDRRAERQQRTLKATGCVWKTAKVGPVLFLLHDGGLMRCAAVLHGLLRGVTRSGHLGMLDLCLVSEMQHMSAAHLSLLNLEWCRAAAAAALMHWTSEWCFCFYNSGLSIAGLHCWVLVFVLN